MNIKEIFQIEPIAVKTKDDVLRADDILSRIGVSIFSSDKHKKDYIEKNPELKNVSISGCSFLCNDKDGWRIQSHYLGDGIPIDKLEEQVSNIVDKFPNIVNIVEEMNSLDNKLKDEINNINLKQEEIKKQVKDSKELIVNKVGKIVIKE